MRRLAIGTHLFEARVDASDQARFFLVIDRLVPTEHRAYARRLLASIVPSQRWGIAAAADRHGFSVRFKGGWRTALTHQVALLQRDGRRLAIAVLTAGRALDGLRRADDRGRRPATPSASGLNIGARGRRSVTQDAAPDRFARGLGV
jgi:hypothetical protein